MGMYFPHSCSFWITMVLKNKFLVGNLVRSELKCMQAWIVFVFIFIFLSDSLIKFDW